MNFAKLVLIPLLACGFSCVPGNLGSGGSTESVSGVIEFDGEVRGALRVAAFSSFPPVGPPIAEVSIEAPTFPQAYELHGLPPGRYFILAMMDADPADGDRYRPRVDPGGAYGAYRNPAAISTDLAQPTQHIDVRMLAPHGGSPWDR